MNPQLQTYLRSCCQNRKRQLEDEVAEISRHNKQMQDKITENAARMRDASAELAAVNNWLQNNS